MQKIYSLYNLQLMLSTFLPFYLLPPVSKLRGVFGGRKLFLPGHFGFIFDGRVETCFYCEVSCGTVDGHLLREVRDIDAIVLCRPLQLYSNAACPKTFVFYVIRIGYL
jgi:hypothetical protein